MSNPVNLPRELFNRILDYALDGVLDVKPLCDFCLVDRQWYATISLRIYSKWTYHGEEHSLCVALERFVYILS